MFWRRSCRCKDWRRWNGEEEEVVEWEEVDGGIEENEEWEEDGGIGGMGGEGLRKRRNGNKRIEEKEEWDQEGGGMGGGG